MGDNFGILLILMTIKKYFSFNKILQMINLNLQITQPTQEFIVVFRFYMLQQFFLFQKAKTQQFCLNYILYRK
ncbi:hypothetical protein pb186bvf_014799 [Paramecium bursaria]